MRRTKPSRSRSRTDAPTAPRSRPPRPRPCRSCAKPLASATDVGWECECGVAVCGDTACFDEYFKLVADGEATRCRSCGAVM